MLIGSSIMLEFDGSISEDRVVVIPVTGLNTFTVTQLRTITNDTCWDVILDDPNMTLLRPMLLGSILVPSHHELTEDDAAKIMHKTIVRSMLMATDSSGSIVRIDLHHPSPEQLHKIIGV